MPAWEGRKYKLEKSDGFDDYLKKAGVGLVPRKLALSVKTTIELVKVSENEYNLVTSSTFKNRVLKFKLGEEYDEETMDGRTVKSVITIEGNTMTTTQKGEHPTTIVREFSENECVMTVTYEDVVAKRWYKALS